MLTAMPSGQFVCVCLAAFVWNGQAYVGADPQDPVDTVVVRRDETGETVERRGTIREWRGAELLLETATGIRKIRNDEIVEVRTEWSGPALLARQAIAARDFAEADRQLAEAIRSESREWAASELKAQRIRVLALLDQPAAAVTLFLELFAADSSTRHFDTIPLAWQNAMAGADLQQAAERWLKSRAPVAQLLGASWLLGSPKRAEALVVLDELSRDIEPRIALLAAAQLWRTRIATVDAEGQQRWREQLERMAEPLRAGPRLVLAEAIARLESPQDAALELMAVPILHREHLVACRAALQRAAEILERAGDTEQAARIRAELEQSFPGR